MQDNLIRDKSFEFALASIELYKVLVARQEYVLSRQFLRSATSIGANVEEALAGFKEFKEKYDAIVQEITKDSVWIVDHSQDSIGYVKEMSFGNYSKER